MYIGTPCSSVRIEMKKRNNYKNTKNTFHWFRKLKCMRHERRNILNSLPRGNFIFKLSIFSLKFSCFQDKFEYTRIQMVKEKLFLKFKNLQNSSLTLLDIYITYFNTIDARTRFEIQLIEFFAKGSKS